MTDVIILAARLARIAAPVAGWRLMRLRINKIAKLSQPWESI